MAEIFKSFFPLQTLLSSPAPATTALPSLALASRRSLDFAFAAVLALAQARLPLLTAAGRLEPINVSEVVPSTAPAAGVAPSSLPSDPMDIPNSSPEGALSHSVARGTGG